MLEYPHKQSNVYPLHSRTYQRIDNSPEVIELRREIFISIQRLRKMSEMRQRSTLKHLDYNNNNDGGGGVQGKNVYNSNTSQGFKRLDDALRPSLISRLVSFLLWPFQLILLAPWNLLGFIKRRPGWTLSGLFTCYALYTVYATATSIEYANRISDAEKASPFCIKMREADISKMPHWCYTQMSIHARRGFLNLMDVTFHTIQEHVKEAVLFFYMLFCIPESLCGSMCRYNITFVCNAIISWSVIIFPALFVFLMIRGSGRHFIKGVAYLNTVLDNAEKDIKIINVPSSSSNHQLHQQQQQQPQNNQSPYSDVYSLKSGMYGNLFAQPTLQHPPPLSQLMYNSGDHIAPRSSPSVSRNVHDYSHSLRLDRN